MYSGQLSAITALTASGWFAAASSARTPPPLQPRSAKRPAPRWAARAAAWEAPLSHQSSGQCSSRSDLPVPR